MTVGISLAQMFSTPYVMGIIQQYSSPGTAFSQFYGLGLEGNVANQLVGRAGQYDIFNGTRSLVPISSPYAAPTRINRMPIGSQSITVPRINIAVGIEEEKIFGMRGIGQQFKANVPSRGEEYFVRQMTYAKTRIINSLEFMCSRMFLGGWGLAPSGTGMQDLKLTELNAGGNIVNNSSLIPATNTGNIGGIIGASWANPATDISSQLFELQKLAAQQNGRRITEIWVNGTTGKHLMSNTKIQAIGGAVNRIYDTFEPNREIAPNQRFPDTGVTIEFGGLPGYRFHIYNQGFVLPGTSEAPDQQIASANWRPFIPDNVAIMTPPPGEWCGMVQGSEPVRWNLRQQESEIVEGFGFGFEEAIEPPRMDVKFLYNGAPVITEPLAVYSATVIF